MKILPCIFGLGYVGLPIHQKLKNSFKCYGYDISVKRVNELKKGYDKQFQFLKSDLLNKKNGSNFTSSLKDISNCNFFIICVPTPIFKNKKPNLSYLVLACKKIAKIIKKMI